MKNIFGLLFCALISSGSLMAMKLGDAAYKKVYDVPELPQFLVHEYYAEFETAILTPSVSFGDAMQYALKHNDKSADVIARYVKTAVRKAHAARDQKLPENEIGEELYTALACIPKRSKLRAWIIAGTKKQRVSEKEWNSEWDSCLQKIKKSY